MKTNKIQFLRLSLCSTSTAKSFSHTGYPTCTVKVNAIIRRGRSSMFISKKRESVNSILAYKNLNHDYRFLQITTCDNYLK